MRLDVHVITAARLPLLKACYASIIEALPADARLTILVNGDDPETVTWLGAQSHPQLSWRQIPRQHRSEARNLAFDQGDGKIIYFLDDDVVVPPDLFERALQAFRLDPELDILGGPNFTPPDSPRSQKLFGAVMTSPFAAPMVRIRYGAWSGPEFAADERHLILCNLAVRRASIPHYLRFQVMTANEENLFLHACRRIGLKARFSPSLYVYHRRRATIRAFADQIFSYGCGRAQQTRLAPASCHVAFVLPALGWLVLALSALVPSLRGQLPWMLGSYFALCFVGSALSETVRAMGFPAVLLVTPLTALVHATYGLGFLRGLSRRGASR